MKPRTVDVLREQVYLTAAGLHYAKAGPVDVIQEMKRRRSRYFVAAEKYMYTTDTWHIGVNKVFEEKANAGDE